MKKVFMSALLLACCLMSKVANAQWTNVPGIRANKIYCGSASQVVAIYGSQTTSDNVSKLNTANNTWASQGNGNINMREITISAAGTIWAIGTTGVFSKTLTGSFVNSNLQAVFNPALKIALTTVPIIKSANANAVVRYNGTSWATSNSDAGVNANELSGASDGTLIAAHHVSNGTGNLFSYNATNGTWPQIPGNMTFGKAAVRNVNQMICRNGVGDLSARFGNTWFYLNRADVIDVSMAADGTIYIATNATTNNVFKSTWDLLACPNLTAPTVSATQTNICGAGSSTVSVDNPITGINYEWNTGTTANSITVNTTGNYSVRAISNGCTSAYSTPTTVTFNTLPEPAAITGPSSLCPGTSATLTMPIITGISYLWDNNSNGASRTITDPGTYIVRAISNGCTSAVVALKTITSLAPARPAITNIGFNCLGSSITLNVTNPITGTTYLWSTGLVANILTTTPTASSQNYTVRAIANGCTSAVSLPITVTSLPPPGVPTIAGSSSVCLAAGATINLSVQNPNSAITYEWYRNTVYRATGNAISVSSTTLGDYTVRAGQNGCPSAQSAIVRVTAPPAAPQINSSAVGICSDATTPTILPIFNPQPNTTYIWSTGQTGNSISVLPTVTTDYTAFAVFSGCTSTVSNTVRITVRLPTPTPIITGLASFCPPTVGAATSIIVSNTQSNTTYVWNTGETGSTSIGATTSGAYSVRAISNGCTSAVSNTINLVVQTPPAIPTGFSATPINICQGGQTTIAVPNPVAGLTYSWSNGQNGTSISVSTAGAYTVRAVNASNCSSAVSAPTTVVVNALPALPNINISNNNTCAVSLSATGGASYVWLFGSVVQSATSATFSPSVSGLYSVRAVSAVGCTSAVSQQLQATVVSTLAAPTIAAAGATTFCAGSSLTLNASGAPTGAVYTWSNGTTGPSTSVTLGGSYSATYTNAGCNSAASAPIVVTVNATPPTPTINTSNNNTCAVSLSASGGASYIWSLGSVIQSTTSATFLPTVSGSYTVRALNGTCPSASSLPIVITIPTAPTVPNITGTSSICPNSNTTLSVANPLANTTYLWSNNSIGNSIIVNNTGDFSVRAISNSCTSAVSPIQTVVFSPLPNIPFIIPGKPSICAGDNIMLSVLPAPSTTYFWSNGASGNSINVNTAGTYTVRAISAAGCSSVASQPRMLSIDALPPTPTINTSNNNTCAVSLSATGGASYIWSLGSVIQSTTSATFSPTVSGSYTVRALSAAACSSAVSAAAVVTVTGVLTAPTVVAAGPTTFCAGGNVTLNASGAPSGASYTWSNGATGPSLIASAAGTYTASYTSVGCNSAASSAIVVSVTNIPNIITQNGNLLALTTPEFGATYQWFLNGQILPIATSDNYIPLVSGAYQVRIKLNGCEVFSNTINVILTSAAGKLNASIKVYPNPTSGIVYVEIEQLADVQILVTDALGRHILSQKAQDKTALQLPKGLYFVRIQNREATSVHKVIVQ